MDPVVIPTAIIALAAIVSPLITGWFTTVSMKSTTKNYIALGVSAVLAVGYVLMIGGFTPEAGFNGIEDLALPLGLIYGIGQFMYNSLMKKPATYVEANLGIHKGDVKKEVVVAETIDGSEVVVAVPEVDEAVKRDDEGGGYVKDTSPKG